MPKRKIEIINKVEELKKAEKVIRAIEHPLRKEILKKLDQKSEANVTEIYTDLKIEQSVASQHLKILREAKAVEAKRQGRSIVYKPNYDNLTKLEQLISQIVMMLSLSAIILYNPYITFI